MKVAAPEITHRSIAAPIGATRAPRVARKRGLPVEHAKHRRTPVTPTTVVAACLKPLRQHLIT
jgi:hypothetical protein